MADKEAVAVEEPTITDKDLTGVDHVLPDVETEGLGGLFDEEEEFNEGQLTGDAVEKKELSPEEVKAEAEAKEKEGKEEADAKAVEDAKAKETKEAKEKADLESKEKAAISKSSEEAKTVPEGFIAVDVHENVKIAMRQERTKARELTSENSSLRNQVAELQRTPKEKEFDGFKVLSDDEVDELANDDPAEAARYVKELTRYEKAKAGREIEAKEAEAVQQRQSREFQAIIDDGIDMIIETVPGLYDDNQPVAQELTDFAVSQGVDVDFLATITDPKGLYYRPSDNKFTPLGKGAAQLVGLINKAFTMSKNTTDSTKITEEAKAELEKEITAKVTKDFLTKLKANPKAFYQDISQVPGESETVTVHDKILTESEMAKLSEVEEEAYLSGE